MSKISSLKKAGPSYAQKFIGSNNPGQNILYKVKKYSKIGQDYKNLVFNCGCFLTAFVKL